MGGDPHARPATSRSSGVEAVAVEALLDRVHPHEHPVQLEQQRSGRHRRRRRRTRPARPRPRARRRPRTCRAADSARRSARRDRRDPNPRARESPRAGSCVPDHLDAPVDARAAGGRPPRPRPRRAACATGVTRRRSARCAAPAATSRGSRRRRGARPATRGTSRAALAGPARARAARAPRRRAGSRRRRSAAGARGAAASRGAHGRLVGGEQPLVAERRSNRQQRSFERGERVGSRAPRDARPAGEPVGRGRPEDVEVAPGELAARVGRIDVGRRQPSRRSAPARLPSGSRPCRSSRRT